MKPYRILLLAGALLLVCLPSAEARQNSQEPSAAFEALLEAAERGKLSVQNQLELGLMYLQGKEVLQDYEEAARWIRAAAGNGHTTAQANLGLMYLQGKGVPQDYEEAAKWIRKAAGQAEISAQHMLGAMYAEGIGVTQDYIEAYKWLTLSVDLAAEKQSQLGQARDESRTTEDGGRKTGSRDGPAGCHQARPNKANLSRPETGGREAGGNHDLKSQISDCRAEAGLVQGRDPLGGVIYGQMGSLVQAASGDERK